MFVPLNHEGVKGWSFKFVCPGYALSISHERLLLLKNATVNRNLGFDEVCKEKRVSIAFNNEEWVFWAYGVPGNMQMWRYPVHPEVRYRSVAWEWEVQAAFFENNNIIPHWIYCNYDWGTLNYTTGQWSGAIGLIQRDEADYALCCFSGTYPRSKVAAFSPGTQYIPYHWLTRYPLELPPTWNLLGLFTKGVKAQISNLNPL